MTSGKKLLISQENGFRTDIGGLVSMLTEQFSDPVLCFRELVQNSIDENASKIELQFSYDHDKNLLALSSVDDGAGMDYKKLKKYLTVFDSTKEDLKDKIGKFGIGKLSLFALKPELLVVETGDGDSGHKVVINNDLSGRLLKTKPRKGTKVTILKNTPIVGADVLRMNIISYIKDSCKYSPVPIIVDSDIRIGGKLDVDARYKMPFEFKTSSGYDVKGINSIIDSDNSRFLALKGGLKLGEVKYPFRGRNSTWKLFGLETIVDSFGFNHPLSRNKVYEDENFRDIGNKIVNGPLREFSVFCCSKLEKDSSVEGFLLNYISVLSEAKKPEDAPEELLKAKLFETTDGEKMSFDEIEKSYRKTKCVYISRSNALEESKYFRERNIPVIKQGNNAYSCFNVLKNWCDNLVSIDEDTTVINYNQRRKSEKAKKYLSLVSGLFSDKDYFHAQKLSRTSEEESTEKEDDRCAGFFKRNVDLSLIKSAKFGYFYALDEEPARWKTMDIEDNTLVLNAYSDYVQSMIKLSGKNPKLAKFYTLCEVVRNKNIFPNIRSADAEDFTMDKVKEYLK